VINWHVYNESLVRRGEIILDFDVLDNWNNELKHRFCIVKKLDKPFENIVVSGVTNITGNVHLTK
jgi:hypothetical protein